MRFPQVKRGKAPAGPEAALPGAAGAWARPVPAALRALPAAVPTFVISVCPARISACGPWDPPGYRALILPGHGLQSKAYYSVNDPVLSSEDLGQGLHAN